MKHIEIITYLSDYVKAEELLDKIVEDLAGDKDNGLLKLYPPETLQLISLLTYVYEKRGRTQCVVDFCESILVNEDIMKKCNPFAIYYIIEYTRFNPRLSEVTQYESEYMKELRANFYSMRLKIKQKWLEDPNFLHFNQVDPRRSDDDDLYEIAVWFIEALSNHLIFLRAVQVEFRANFKKFF